MIQELEFSDTKAQGHRNDGGRGAAPRFLFRAGGNDSLACAYFIAAHKVLWMSLSRL